MTDKATRGDEATQPSSTPRDGEGRWSEEKERGEQHGGARLVRERDVDPSLLSRGHHVSESIFPCFELACGRPSDSASRRVSRLAEGVVVGRLITVFRVFDA